MPALSTLRSKRVCHMALLEKDYNLRELLLHDRGDVSSLAVCLVKLESRGEQGLEDIFIWIHL